MRFSNALVLISAGWIGVSTPSFSQARIGAKPSFDVAVVKPNSSTDSRVAVLGQPGGRFIATNASVMMLIRAAYSVQDFQVSGGPNWIDSDRWDIEARAEAGRIPEPIGLSDPNTFDPLSLRVQSLLEDRFQLKWHFETKELPVYALVVLKSGSKMKLNEDQTPPQPRAPGATPPPQPTAGQVPRYSMRRGRGVLVGTAVTVGIFINSLSQLMGRMVIDKTDLKGFYEVRLEWPPDAVPGTGPTPIGPETPPPIEPSGPSIFTAIQDQLGLKLESTKAPVRLLVIDSVQKPSAN
jgi:bla regulator protein blaR1